MGRRAQWTGGSRVPAPGASPGRRQGYGLQLFHTSVLSVVQLCLRSALRGRYSIIGALRHSGGGSRQKVIYYAHSVTRAHTVIYRGAGILWFKGRRLVSAPNYYRTFGKRTPALRSASLF